MEGKNKAPKTIWYYSHSSFFMTDRKGRININKVDDI